MPCFTIAGVHRTVAVYIMALFLNYGFIQVVLFLLTELETAVVFKAGTQAVEYK